MSKNSSRSVKKKISTPTVYPLAETKAEKLPNNKINKNSLTNDILHDEKITQFILEEDVINFFPATADNNSSGSQSSWTDDLEVKSTNIVKAEYDLVERLLYGEEKFGVYNEEFDQWVDNFKYLRFVLHIKV